MKTNFALMIIAATTLGLVACDEKTSSETTERSTVNGTTIESTTSTEATRDSDGNVTRDTERKTTVDPEGAMNKETIEDSHTTTEESR